MNLCGNGKTASASGAGSPHHGLGTEAAQPDPLLEQSIFHAWEQSLRGHARAEINF
jgi:hypothetical protein